MTDAPHALVVGGSVGGLLAARLLRSIGWLATVFERTVGDLAGRGAGLGISAELLDVMRRAGARFDPSAGAAHAAYVWMGADGRILFRHDRATVGSTWARVYRPLRDGIPAESYRQGMTLQRVEQGPGSVRAIFADGSRVAGDLLVAADGVFSTVRKQFAPEVEPRYAGYVAWRGIAEERRVGDATVAAIGGNLVFCFPEGEMLLAMPAPGADEDMQPGRRRFYAIWYRPVAERGLADLFTDAAGERHGLSIPPPSIRPELVAALHARAREALPPPVAGIVTAAPQPMLQAVTDLESPRMTFGRVALLGDAAFVARPHVAGGVSKAALDAACLADSLAAAGGDVDAALARYDREQHAFGRRLVAHSRYLGAGLEGYAGPPRRRRGDERRRDERRIIRDYGAPHLLRDVDAAGFPSHVG